MSWTNDRVDTLKKLWADGQSASAIATKLGEVTRNAVIGKAHRLGLAGRATTARRPRSPRRASPCHHRPARRSRQVAAFAAAPRKAAAAKPMPVALGPEPEFLVTIATLTERVCHWPQGDPKILGFHFCGRSKDQASGPYCGAPAAIAHH